MTISPPASPLETVTRSDEQVVDVSSLCVSYARESGWVEAVSDLTFQLAPGKSIGVVGESGSGKSTAVLRLLGYRQENVRSSGSVLLSGRQMLDIPESKARLLRGAEVAFVPQNPLTSLTPNLRVGSQVVEAMRVHGLPQRDCEVRSIELLEEVGLPDPAVVSRKFPHQLSGGQQQRVVIAMAIACSPKVIVLDEPTTALDVTTQARIIQLLRKLVAAHSTSLVYVSHDLGVVGELCDDIAVMRDGRMVEYGSAMQVLREPKHEYTRELVEAIPRIRPSRTSSVKAVASPSSSILSVYALSCSYARRTRWSKSNGTDVVRGVSFSVESGSTTAIVGESGSGKSTLAKAIMGILSPTAGSIEFADEKLAGSYEKRSRELRRRIQMVPQNPDASLNPSQKVGEAIVRPLRMFTSLSRSQIRERVVSLLEDVQLDASYARRLPRELSGGERQRVAIARALAPDPDLVLCDEILSALDVTTQADITKLLLSLQADRGVGYVFISHDLAVVQSFADEVVVLYHGEICESGAPNDVFTPPYHPYTHRLLSAIPGVPASDSPRAASTGLQLHTAGLQGCVFRGQCEFEIDLCQTQPPVSRDSRGHEIYCHRIGDVAGVLTEPIWP